MYSKPTHETVSPSSALQSRGWERSTQLSVRPKKVMKKARPLVTSSGPICISGAFHAHAKSVPVSAIRRSRGHNKRGYNAVSGAASSGRVQCAWARMHARECQRLRVH